MQVKISEEQIKKVQAEWKVIRDEVASAKARQAEYSRYYTFHHLLDILGLLNLVERREE